MKIFSRHREKHRTDRIGWLRAAVLGANDGIVSTASLVLGVAAAGAKPHDIVVAGGAGLMAGAMSMAAGEYVSVHSQADTEKAELERERLELEMHPDAEHAELAGIYTAAAGCHGVGAGAGPECLGWRYVAVVFGAAGRAGCPCGRRRRFKGRMARHLLGSFGNGRHGRRGGVVRQCGLKALGANFYTAR